MVSSFQWLPSLYGSKMQYFTVKGAGRLSAGHLLCWDQAVKHHKPGQKHLYNKLVPVLVPPCVAPNFHEHQVRNAAVAWANLEGAPWCSPALKSPLVLAMCVHKTRSRCCSKPMPLLPGVCCGGSRVLVGFQFWDVLKSHFSHTHKLLGLLKLASLKFFEVLGGF